MKHTDKIEEQQSVAHHQLPKSGTGKDKDNQPQSFADWMKTNDIKEFDKDNGESLLKRLNIKEEDPDKRAQIAKDIEALNKDRPITNSIIVAAVSYRVNADGSIEITSAKGDLSQVKIPAGEFGTYKFNEKGEVVNDKNEVVPRKSAEQAAASMQSALSPSSSAQEIGTPAANTTPSELSRNPVMQAAIAGLSGTQASPATEAGPSQGPAAAPNMARTATSIAK